MNTKEMIEWLEEKTEEIESRKRKPGHGVCCTCQKCGHCHDDCTCYDEEAIAAIIKTLKEYTTLKKEYAEYDKLIRLMEELRKRIHHRS